MQCSPVHGVCVPLGLQDDLGRQVLGDGGRAERGRPLPATQHLRLLEPATTHIEHFPKVPDAAATIV